RNITSASTLWAGAQDATSLALATSFEASGAAAVTAVGRQAALVESDLKGVTVPAQIVIAGDGVPGGEASPGGIISVAYSFTNVGDKPLPAGTATLLTDTNVSLLSAATV